ncbi:MAG: PQQ-binding-like beta-propeller repeat protein [Verrucomicrobiae bacterium]|nr:PQQ-binding-like beta-propeller repeat protein [Verrucomicrobiae bacterium]
MTSPISPPAVGRPLALLALTGLLSLSPARAGDWPALRGPNQDGISTETGLKISGELAVAWKAQVGLGHSAIVVANGKAYTLGHDGRETETLWCFDAGTGAVVWKYSHPHPLDDLYFPGGSTGTPTVEDGAIYFVARRGQLFALDAGSGQIKWQKHLTEDFDCPMPDWGFTGGPRPHGDLLLLNANNAGLALKKADGSLAWTSKKGEAGYSTPRLFEKGGRPLALFSNKDGYTCVDPADGKELWFFKHKTRYGVNATEPLVAGDRLFIATGYGKGSALLEWSGAGEPKELRASRDFAAQMNPPLLIGGRLYGIHGDEGKDGTGLKCLDFESGETLWLDTSTGHGAVTAAGDRLIVLTESGELRVGPATPEGFKPTLTRKVFGPKCWTVPVLLNGRLFLRNSAGEVVVLTAE